MRIRLAVPDQYVTPEFIESALEATTRGNQALLQAGVTPTATELLARGNKWKPERYGDGEHFDLLPTIGDRGWGDCDDWAPGFAAELRETGQDPGARAIIRRSGEHKWHALVQTSDGKIHDPSQWAGMPSPSTRPPLASQMFGNGVAGMVLSPAGRRGWFARCDLPMGECGHIVGIGYGCPNPDLAMRAAIASVAPSHVMGDDVIGTYNHIVGDLFGDILPVAAGLAGTALGGPLGGMAGAAAGKLAAGALSGGGGGGGGGGDASVPAPGTPTQQPTQFAGMGGGPGAGVYYGPGAPIIIRF